MYRADITGTTGRRTPAFAAAAFAAIAIAAIAFAAVGCSDDPVREEAAPGPQALRATVAFQTSGYAMDVTHEPGSDRNVWVAMQAGDIHQVTESGNTHIGTIPVVSGRKGLFGLTAIALHPDFATQPYLYATFLPDSFTVRLARFSVDMGAAPGAKLNLASEVVLDETPRNHPTQHNSCDVVFHPLTRELHVSYGDGSVMLWGEDGGARDMQRNSGKLWNYGAPPVQVPPNKTIRAYGLRNPYRFGFDSQTGDVWIGDVGLSKYEEINVVRSSENMIDMGWPVFQGPECAEEQDQNVCDSLVSSARSPQSFYRHDSFSQPADGWCWASVIGGFVYRHTLITELHGQFIYGDFCHRLFKALDVMSGDTRDIVVADLPSDDSVSWVCIGYDNAGRIYVGDGEAAIFYRIAPE